jgi:membrane-associated phospholipid phosphatase
VAASGVWFRLRPDTRTGNVRRSTADGTAVAPTVAAISLWVLLAPALAYAGGGPLGIDHRWNYDNSGIWKRSNQDLLRYGALVADIGLALWEGDSSRLGRSAWQSVDSVVLAGVAAEAAKRVFGRERPGDTNDPNQWFKSGNRSFPSGEVAEISSIITPYVLEYRHDHPAVWALELLPAYDAVARMKVQAHWQTDVLAGFALGTAAGIWAHERKMPLIVSVLPHGFAVGLKKQF